MPRSVDGGARCLGSPAVADIAIFTLAMAVSGETELQFFAILGAIIASSVLVGALLMTRATGNNVGPLLLIAGTTQTANLVVGEYVAHLVEPGGPIALVANGLNQVVLTWALLAILIGVPLIFPDGHLPSRRWRFVVWLTIAGMVAFAVVTLFKPGPIAEGSPDNPLGVLGFEPVFLFLNALASFGALVGFGGAVVSIAVRFRRGRGIERQQLKWVLVVAGVAAVAFLAGAFLPAGLARDIALNLGLLSLIAMPVAIGIAVLRYRLYEIDRLVSRTIAYAVVTGGLIVVYLVVNLGLTTAFSSLASGNSAVVAASTLVGRGVVHATPSARSVVRGSPVQSSALRRGADGERLLGATAKARWTCLPSRPTCS